MEVQIDVNMQTETMSIAFGILEVSYNFSMLRHMASVDWLPKTLTEWQNKLETDADHIIQTFAEMYDIWSEEYYFTYNIISA